MEIWPPTRLTMMEGMKNGLTRRWPFCTAVGSVSSSAARPPMPEPTITPTRSPSGLSVGRPASFRARSVAARPNWMKRSFLRASFFSMNFAGSKPLTSPAILLGRSLTSKRVMGPTPDFPAMAASHDSLVPIPKVVTRPIPVTTTLRSTRCMICDLFLVLVDEVHRVLDRLDVLRLLIGDLDREAIVAGAQLHFDIEGVRAEASK